MPCILSFKNYFRLGGGIMPRRNDVQIFSDPPRRRHFMSSSGMIRRCEIPFGIDSKNESRIPLKISG